MLHTAYWFCSSVDESSTLLLLQTSSLCHDAIQVVDDVWSCRRHSAVFPLASMGMAIGLGVCVPCCVVCKVVHIVSAPRCRTFRRTFTPPSLYRRPRRDSLLRDALLRKLNAGRWSKLVYCPYHELQVLYETVCGESKESDGCRAVGPTRIAGSVDV